MSLQELIKQLKKEEKELEKKQAEYQSHKIMTALSPKKTMEFTAIVSALAYNRELQKRLGVK